MAGKDTKTARITAQLEGAISGGRYPAGALLPSLRQIMDTWQVSTTTARSVLRDLVADGYARADSTRGHLSTGGPAASGGDPEAGGERMLATGPGARWPRDGAAEGTLPGQAPRSAGPDLALGRAGARPAAAAGLLRSRQPVTISTADAARWPENTGAAGASLAELAVSGEAAPAAVAAALDLRDPGERVMVRRRLLAAPDGQPAELRTTWIPAAVAADSPLAAEEPIGQPWPGALASTGRRVTSQSSAIGARHPSDSEAAALGLHPAGIVLVHERISYAGGQPTEVTRHVWPAEATQIITTETTPAGGGE